MCPLELEAIIAMSKVYCTIHYGTVQYSSHSQELIQFFIFKFPGTLSKKGNQSTVHYVTVPCCSVLYQRCQGTKGAQGVSGQKLPRLLEFKRCKGCQGIKGAKGAWVKSSQGLLGGRVFSRTHFRSSLTPEEGPSC